MKITGLPVPNPEKKVNQHTPVTNQKTKVNPGMPPSIKAPTKSIHSNILQGKHLPQDRLSTAIISIARFFSLPLNTAFLAKIRRQIQSHQNTPNKTSSETLSLAAMAAADKGIELSRNGLEKYTSVINPFESEPQDEKENDVQAQKKPAPASKAAGEQDSVFNSLSGLKKIVLQTAEQNPLLEIMNRLPGKNGQRFIVLPFDCGNEYRACLKILLNDSAHGSACQMALEIVDIGKKNPEKQVFIIDSKNGEKLRLKHCRTGNRIVNEKKLVSGLSECLNIPPENIIIQNFINIFPLEADNLCNVMFSINEEA